ncbi:hypothetical protein [Pasteurella testudinis]|uniref:hypothetical protein n=1 Tax=Pasteurella testudinis TaxID=761 RepID=UPI00117FA18B|nr:hypothetical protein [Pasteurella testudinis]
MTAQVANGQVHFGTTDELEPVGILAVRYGEVLANADTARGVFNDVGSGIRYTVKGTKNGHGRVLSVTFNGVKNPSTTDTVRALVYFAPTRDSVECEIPRDSGLFLRAISALVMAKLYVMPNRPWTDLGQSQYHYGIYADLLVQAKRQAKSNDIPVVRECKFSW